MSPVFRALRRAVTLMSRTRDLSADEHRNGAFLYDLTMRTVALALLLLPAAFADSVRFQGFNISYDAAGPRSDATVVLIHGWACDASFWRLQMRELSRRFRVLAVDLPGHGRSDKPQITYDGALFAQAVRAIMDVEKVQRAVLIGHSMGTEIAGRLVNDMPDRVLALVSLDGVVITDWTEAGIREVRQWGASMRSSSGVEVRRKFIEGLFTAATPPELRTEIVTGMLATPSHVAASAMESAPRWDFRSSIQKPVLAISTQKGSERRRKMHQQAFADLEYIEMERVGHFLHMEKPAEVNAMVIRFLDRVTQTASRSR